jgi:integrase
MLLSELREPARTAVFVALATGLRVSELLALQWQDIDFSNNTITPVRGIVDNIVGGLKTVSSAAAVPASQEVTDVLARWRERTLYTTPTDRVFPSPKMGGTQPYGQDSGFKGRIHFAGEHTCYAFSRYMEAALRSGLRIAEHLARRDRVI